MRLNEFKWLKPEDDIVILLIKKRRRAQSVIIGSSDSIHLAWETYLVTGFSLNEKRSAQFSARAGVIRVDFFQLAVETKLYMEILNPDYKEVLKPEMVCFDMAYR